MPESEKVFTGSIPEFYDLYMVPMLFHDFAMDMAERVHALGPRDVLETAAGSGVVTRALTPGLRADARYVVTDFNPSMLDRARARQAPDPRITWTQADALHLPFADDSFDVLCCQFGVMFYPDRITGFREARRVLRPGAVMVFNSWDCIETNEFAEEVEKAVKSGLPHDPPDFMARTPHGYFDSIKITADLRAAGFREIQLDTRDVQSSAASARDVAIAFCHGTPLRGEILKRAPDGLDRITDLAEQAVAARFGSGPVSARMRGHVLTAIA